MCDKMVSRLPRHIRENHQLKHTYYRCSTCSWSALRRCDVARHCTSARHGTVVQSHCEEGFVSLRRCSCGFVGLDLQGHRCSGRLHRFRGSAMPAVSQEPQVAQVSPVPQAAQASQATASSDEDCVELVPLDDPAIVRITPVLPVSDPVLDRLFDECVTTVVEFLESEHDSELDCNVPTIVIN